MIPDISQYQKQSEAQHSQSDDQKDEELVLKQKNQKFKQSVPQEYYKAKKMLTKMINQYFKELKIELIEKKGRVQFNRGELYEVQTAISKYVTVRYKNIEQLTIEKPPVSDQLLYYVPQKGCLWKLTGNQKFQIIQIQKQSNKVKLPDIATPVCLGSNAYLLDGAEFDQETGTFIPAENPLKINLVTGEISLLKNQQYKYHVRIKSALIKSKEGAFIVGGYAGRSKIITSKCQFFNEKSKKFENLPNTKKLHRCPTGCLHQNQIFIFSQMNIEVYNIANKSWMNIQTPPRLNSLPFQFCISLSDQEIMLIGGKSANKNSQNTTLINLKDNTVDIYADLLPIGVCAQRSSGPTIIFGHISIISSVQASKYPYASNRAQTAQNLYIGSKGCFIKEILTNK